MSKVRKCDIYLAARRDGASTMEARTASGVTESYARKLNGLFYKEFPAARSQGGTKRTEPYGPPRPPMAAIAKRIYETHGLSIDALRAADRRRPTVRVRQEFIAKCIGVGHRPTRIGRFLRRDHTTVLYSAQKWASLQAEASQ